MINTREIKIRRTDNLTSKYIDDELRKKGLDILRWAITDYNEEYYTLNISVVETD